ncbi:MAG TPA: undecaprenyl-diphosphatase UppP [Gaiellaceae bacterium]|nr:undecaprenyl-diphosphatase UppP [Gaiellaceae bacterium]
MRRAGILAVAGAALAAAAGLALSGVGAASGALTGWQAFVLGVVQGATELLPISSSGHLILVRWLFGWEDLEASPELAQTFDVALHVGTLVAVVAYFRADLARLIAAWVASVRRRRVETPDERIAWFVAIATVPAALVGALGETAIAEHLGNPWQIAVLLAVFGGVLWLADRTPARRSMSDLGPGTALAVGLAQSLALMPGVSRSGITITAGRFLALDRDSAARFSFLLLVPIVFGASVWKGVTDVLLGELPEGAFGPFVVGVLAAAGSGLLAIWGLLGYVRRHDYTIFVLYRLVAAAAIVLLIVAGARDATL